MAPLLFIWIACSEHLTNLEQQSDGSSSRSGEQVYAQVCAACHRTDGGGIVGVYPPLNGSEWVTQSNEVLIKIVLNGLMGEITVKGVKYNNVMSPWGSVLNDQEVANVLTYVRTAWVNQGDAVTSEEVAIVRKKNAGHAPWQESELMD